MFKRFDRTLRETVPLASALVIAGCGNSSSPLESGGLSAALAGELPSTTGSGHTVVAGELRTFSFTAQQRADGTAQGTAQINNRSIGEMFQVAVDCLKVVDNVAIMSGIVTKHTDVNAIGLTGIFGVIDAGEGSGAAADSVSQVFFFRPETLTCQEIDPGEVGPLAAPIVSGNVQVH